MSLAPPTASLPIGAYLDHIFSLPDLADFAASLPPSEVGVGGGVKRSKPRSGSSTASAGSSEVELELGVRNEIRRERNRLAAKRSRDNEKRVYEGLVREREVLVGVLKMRKQMLLEVLLDFSS